ncbi:type II secretion system F family protein [Marinobacter sp. M216]|uniref:Type II secretion system F family protein n=1 Tax=Marinobacter albus TaxID=3030833 RepID=A0ABT7HCE3_9GAMM|nr:MULTISPECIES: type II secretion system F family protein [unclassified Marinobacter]MBW7469753.1 type II secretion system F family protein [Marinobacter sp. F4218]MDK9557988.1 type II secretion system F family protein [Marinobacter sp. M216]
MEVLGENLWIFVALVFTAVFLLSQGLVIPVFGESRSARKRMRRRMKTLTADADNQKRVSLLRDHYTQNLNPLEKRLELLDVLEPLRNLIAQSGMTTPAYRVLLLALALAAIGAGIAWSLNKAYWAPAVGAPLGFILPFLHIRKKRVSRIARIEEQLPDVVDVIIRALRAGHPFVEAIRLVSTEMPSPVREEFRTTFNEINYGGDVRAALMGLLQRVPSILVMALVTAVLVQRESGGNLAEVLEKIAAVIRGRFRFQRRVRTLSAEGRISAWVLTMTPFVLFLVISVVNPDYMPMLTESPRGGDIILVALVLIVLGVFWIKKILNLKV